MILDLMIERTATVVAVKAVAAKASTINKFIMFDCLGYKGPTFYDRTQLFLKYFSF